MSQTDDETIDLRALLDTLGIDHQNNSGEIHSDVNLMALMNVTLQCLGGIRLMVIKQRREKHALALQQYLNDEKSKILDDASRALRITFVQAAGKILKRIAKGSANHDIDPSKHLIESFPNMSTIGSKHWLPLQWAVLGEEESLTDSYDKCLPSKEIETINSYNNSFKYYDSDAINKSVDKRLEIIELIGNNYPETIEERDKEGRTFLHYACRLDSVDLIDSALKVANLSKTISLGVTNSNGALPFHNTARFSTSLEVLKHVRSLYPIATTVGNNDMTLPLHWAAAKTRNFNIILELWKAFPDAIKTANNEGYLPLHCSGQNNCIEVVKTVYNLYPDAIKVPDNEGGYPLHHACCFTTSVKIVKFMYEAYPEAMTLAQHSDNVTPLHLAAAQNESPEVMKYILELSPDAAFARDNGDCLRILLKANRSGATVKTNTGETPLDMAKEKALAM
eukprot:gene19480-25364_t